MTREHFLQLTLHNCPLEQCKKAEVRGPLLVSAPHVFIFVQKYLGGVCVYEFRILKSRVSKRTLKRLDNYFFN